MTMSRWAAAVIVGLFAGASQAGAAAMPVDAVSGAPLVGAAVRDASNATDFAPLVLAQNTRRPYGDSGQPVRRPVPQFDQSAPQPRTGVGVQPNTPMRWNGCRNRPYTDRFGRHRLEVVCP